MNGFNERTTCGTLRACFGVGECRVRGENNISVVLQTKQQKLTLLHSIDDLSRTLSSVSLVPCLSRRLATLSLALALIYSPSATLSFLLSLFLFLLPGIMGPSTPGSSGPRSRVVATTPAWTPFVVNCTCG